MIIWIVFLAFILFALALDLGVFNKTPHEISTKEATMWTGIWVFCALAFSVVIYFAFLNQWVDNPTNLKPKKAVVKYITGYLIELSLSVDNIFVIALIFSSFSIPKKYQHEVLFYGILSAVVFRAIMIFFGVALISKFDWIVYVFGVFLIFTAFRMLFLTREDEEEKQPQNSIIYKWINKIYPITHKIENDKFFIKENGVKYATPLFVALIIIEFTDIFFAVDSIPAILAITADPFIVFSSNVLAIMGLRSMYFLVSGMLDKFRFITYSLVVILAFVGFKMLFSHQLDLPEWLSITVIVVALTGGIVASYIIIPEKSKE